MAAAGISPPSASTVTPKDRVALFYAASTGNIAGLRELMTPKEIPLFVPPSGFTWRRGFPGTAPPWAPDWVPSGYDVLPPPPPSIFRAPVPQVDECLDPVS
jgi:hypothetical protein